MLSASFLYLVLRTFSPCRVTLFSVCVNSYLDIKIKEGDAHNIVCPAFDCNKLVPVEFIEKTVSTTMAQRYLQFDIKVSVIVSRYICLLVQVTHAFRPVTMEGIHACMQRLSH